MGRRYKTPSRRRLNKWRSRVERLAYRGVHRGFRHWFAELLRCQPLIETAKRAGVDLLSGIPRPAAIEPAELSRLLYQFILGREYPGADWPTRENLEI